MVAKSDLAQETDQHGGHSAHAHSKQQTYNTVLRTGSRATEKPKMEYVCLKNVWTEQLLPVPVLSFGPIVLPRKE
jgi:hypothetical protein